MSNEQVIYQQGLERVCMIPEWASKIAMDDLVQSIQWKQNKIRVYGKIYDEPRLTAWFGPAYAYSNIQWSATPMPIALQTLVDDLQTQCDFKFNAVLCNYYRDGHDAMGWHSDNEPEMNQACIASISLGATRTLKFKERKGIKQFQLELSHGDLLVMEHMQTNWLHAIPKRLKVSEPRLNLTFRHIIES
jgi:alkylated DNA repair dioxygenase AlkB